MGWTDKERAHRLIDKYRKWFWVQYDINDSVYTYKYNNWIQENGFSRSSCVQFIKKIIIDISKDYSAREDNYDKYNNLHILSFELWLLIFRKEKIYDVQIRRLINYYCLRRDVANDCRYKGFPVVTVLAKGCCEQCEGYNDRSFHLDQTIKEMPIPFHFCTRKEGCNCGFMVEDSDLVKRRDGTIESWNIDVKVSNQQRFKWK